MRRYGLAIAGILAFFCAGAQAADKEFTVTGIGGAGGMFTPASSPDDPDFMLVSCDMSGAYRSTDGGKHWEMIHWSQLHSSLGCRPLFAGDAIYWVCGGELRVSRDKAKTWTPVVAGKAPWTGAVSRLCATVGLPDRAAQDTAGQASRGTEASRGTTLFVGTDAGLWRSPDGGKTWSACGKGKCYAVAALGKKVYASLDLKYLVCSDGGETWEVRKAPLLPADGSAGASPSQGHGFQALAGGTKDGATRLFGVVFKVGILKSDDEGKTWTLADKFRDCNDIQMPANQTEVAYAVQEGQRGERGVWRTRDGGKSWENCFRLEVAPRNVQPSWVQTLLRWSYTISPHGFGVNPADPKIAMVTTQGDFYVSRDGGDSWSQVMDVPVGVEPGDPGFRLASNGLEVTSCWQYVFDPFERDRRYIAYTDIGFARSVDADKTWIWSAKGCPWSNTFYQVVCDPKIEGRLYAATSNRHDIPHWTHTDANNKWHAGGVCVSDDGAVTWRVLGKGLPKLPCTSLCVDPKTTQAPLTFYTTLYEGGVYKSTDNGETWIRKSAGLGNPGNLHAYQVKVHPKTGDVFCSITAFRVGGRDFPVPGGLWKSTDGGESWTDITKSLRLHWPAGFALHPDNPDILYLTAGTIPGGAEGGVYKTTDGGKSWTRLLADADFAKSCPPSYVHCFFINMHPDNPDQLYAGTVGHGLWFSGDGGKTWRRFDRIPFGACQNVAFDPQDRSIMYVTTFGGGVWKGPSQP